MIRHSGARRCRIRFTPDAVEITDDGCGPFDSGAGSDSADSEATGHGLRGLRERAEVAGAALVVDRSADGGFRLRVGW